MTKPEHMKFNQAVEAWEATGKEVTFQEFLGMSDTQFSAFLNAGLDLRVDRMREKARELQHV